MEKNCAVFRRSRSCLKDQPQPFVTTLTNSEFIPVIHRIAHISSNDPPCRWTVETDRGNTEFIINDEKDLRRLSQWSVLVVDARGIRYSIPDTRKLNAYSRRAVEWHV